MFGETIIHDDIKKKGIEKLNTYFADMEVS